jgi:hypothetical protein
MLLLGQGLHRNLLLHVLRLLVACSSSRVGSGGHHHVVHLRLLLHVGRVGVGLHEDGDHHRHSSHHSGLLLLSLPVLLLPLLVSTGLLLLPLLDSPDLLLLLLVSLLGLLLLCGHVGRLWGNCSRLCCCCWLRGSCRLALHNSSWCGVLCWLHCVVAAGAVAAAAESHSADGAGCQGCSCCSCQVCLRVELMRVCLELCGGSRYCTSAGRCILQGCICMACCCYRILSRDRN